MTEQDLKNTKNRVIEEFTREHLYNPLWFNDFFQANIDLDKIKIIQGPDGKKQEDTEEEVPKHIANLMQ